MAGRLTSCGEGVGDHRARFLCRLDRGRAAEAPGFDFLLANPELLYFPSYGHGEGIHEPDILRNFEVCNAIAAGFAYLIFGSTLAGLQFDPGEHGLAEAF